MTKGVGPGHARSIHRRSMSEPRGDGTANRFVPGGFEWGSEDRGEGGFGVKNQAGDAYSSETFHAGEKKVSAGSHSDSKLRT